jgi:hypothetical protein
MAKDKKKDPDRKPKDYDEKDIPKVLKGPISPLGIRKDYGEAEADMLKELPNTPPPVVQVPIDYDSGCPCQECQDQAVSPVTEETCPSEEEVSILVCPNCGTEGPFQPKPPEGVPLEVRSLKCAKCKTSIKFNSIVKTASGKYVTAGSRDVQSLVDRIRGLIKLGQVMSWDIVNDINISLDEIVKKSKEKNSKTTED